MEADTGTGEVHQRVEDNRDLIEVVIAQLGKLGTVDAPHRRCSADREDLRASGLTGLVEAARRFSPEYGVEFRRFAYSRVRGAIIDSMRKDSIWTRRGYERVMMLRAIDTFYDSEYRPPQLRLVGSEAKAESEAAESDVPQPDRADTIRRLRDHMANLATAMALGVFAQPVLQDEGYIARGKDPEPDDLFLRKESGETLRAIVKKLPEPDQTIIVRHYLEGVPLNDIALAMGHSRSWASRVHTRALRKLRYRLEELAFLG